MTHDDLDTLAAVYAHALHHGLGGTILNVGVGGYLPRITVEASYGDNDAAGMARFTTWAHTLGATTAQLERSGDLTAEGCLRGGQLVRLSVHTQQTVPKPAPIHLDDLHVKPAAA